MTDLKAHLFERLTQKDTDQNILVDGYWGVGKTTLCENLKNKLIGEKYLVILIDAWKIDYFKDPLLPVMSTLIQTIQNHHVDQNVINKVDLLKKKMGDLASNYIKHKYPWVSKSKRSLVQDYMNLEELITSFEKSLRDIIEYFETSQDGNLQKLPIIILVDELDRCKPDFALSLLERIKHLSRTKNINYCFFANVGQLKHMVQKVYGEIEGEDYLRRFFDRSYRISPDDYTSCIENWEHYHDTKIDISYLNQLAQYYKLSYRDLEQALSFIDEFGKQNSDPRYILHIVLLYIIEHHDKASWEDILIKNLTPIQYFKKFSNNNILANYKNHYHIGAMLVICEIQKIDDELELLIELEGKASDFEWVVRRASIMLTEYSINTKNILGFSRQIKAMYEILKSGK